MTYGPVKPPTASSGEEADGAAGPARATEKRLSLKKKICFNVVAVGLSGIALMLALEVALRLYHGELLATKLLGQPVWSLDQSYVVYDPLLGYVPQPGRYEISDSYVMTIGTDGLRLNGEQGCTEGAPILAVGDSFTFGAEVHDHETWPAQLEKQLGRRVLNGGVSGYGVDQAVLRGERLMEKYEPTIVILAFISENIERSELSFRQTWKPYFDVNNHELELRNVPVPTRPPPTTPLRRVLGRSYLAHAVLRRLVPEWWYLNNMKREHGRGEEAVCLMLSRLAERSHQQGAKLIVVTLHGRGRDMSHLAPVVAHARNIGLVVLDLAPKIAKMAEQDPNSEQAMFRPSAHLSPSLNAWVAARVAEHLKGLTEEGGKGEG